MKVTQCPVRYAYGYKPMQQLPVDDEMVKVELRVNKFNDIPRIKKEQYKEQ